LIGGGDPNKQPGWAPKPEIDYVDRTCPFTSGVWGAVFPVQQFNPLSNRNEQGMGQAQGTTYQRCNRSCMLFVSDPEVKPEEKARGTCSITLAAQGGLAVVAEIVPAMKGLLVGFTEVAERQKGAADAAHDLLNKAHEQLGAIGDEDSDPSDSKTGNG
jgi:hypothetical protein